jgi:putative flippase GtrA
MHRHTEIFKYLIVGGLNTVFTFIIFYGSLNVFRLHYLIALTLAWALGITFTYALNFVWVFKPEKQLVFHQRFAKYFTANLFSLVVNLIALDVLVKLTEGDAFIVQLSLVVPLVIFNYIAAKFWSLKKNKPVVAVH